MLTAITCSDKSVLEGMAMVTYGKIVYIVPFKLSGEYDNLFCYI